MVSATPDSCARICWVRSAMRAAVSLGSASASSYEFVCSDCAPPQTAESAWIATRTMLFSGCCAVSVEPPVDRRLIAVLLECLQALHLLAL